MGFEAFQTLTIAEAGDLAAEISKVAVSEPVPSVYEQQCEAFDDLLLDLTPFDPPQSDLLFLPLPEEDKDFLNQACASPDSNPDEQLLDLF